MALKDQKLTPPGDAAKSEVARIGAQNAHQPDPGWIDGRHLSTVDPAYDSQRINAIQPAAPRHFPHQRPHVHHLALAVPDGRGVEVRVRRYTAASVTSAQTPPAVSTSQSRSCQRARRLAPASHAPASGSANSQPSIVQCGKVSVPKAKTSVNTAISSPAAQTRGRAAQAPP